jgi:hypothetical protein
MNRRITPLKIGSLLALLGLIVAIWGVAPAFGAEETKGAVIGEGALGHYYWQVAIAEGIAGKESEPCLFTSVFPVGLSDRENPPRLGSNSEECGPLPFLFDQGNEGKGRNEKTTYAYVYPTSVTRLVLYVGPRVGGKIRHVQEPLTPASPQQLAESGMQPFTYWVGTLVGKCVHGEAAYKANGKLSERSPPMPSCY